MADNNVYNEFYGWLFDGRQDTLIPDQIINEKAKFSLHFLMNLFLKNKTVCFVVNKYLNNYDFAGLEFEDICKILKFLVLRFRIPKTSIFYSKFIYENVNKEISEIICKYPHLKYKEVEMLLDDFKRLCCDSSKSTTTKKHETSQKFKIKFEDMINEFSQIKKNCPGCALLGEPLCLFDTNAKSNVYGIDFLFVGEAPGENEAKEGKPFVGKSGKILRDYIQKFIIKNRLKYFITNSVLCRPPQNKIDVSYVDSCSANLDKVISMLNPKILVAVGSTAMNRLLKIKDGITKIHGQLIPSKEYNKPVFVLLHPSFIVRNACPVSVYDDDFTILIDKHKIIENSGGSK